MKPSPHTILRVRQLQKFLLEEPRRFNLSYWGGHIEPNTEPEDQTNQLGEYIDEDLINAILDQKPPCGTIACLAGSVCVMAGLIKPTDFKGTQVYEFQPDTPKRAAEWLGIGEGDWRKLFYLESWGYYIDTDDGGTKRIGWPINFEIDLLKCEPGTPEYAAVGVARLEHYIQMGE